MVKIFKEEIEQVDVNLVRYNVKGESTAFQAKIQVYNKNAPAHTIVTIKDARDQSSKPADSGGAKKGFRCCLKVSI